MGRVLCLCALAVTLYAADDTQKMLSRVAEEADAFHRLAPSLLAQETLDQKARKPAPRFRPRVGADARSAPPIVWQDRQIVSEYGFVTLAGEQETLHELRRVISVDGHPVHDKKSEDSLAKIISLKDDQRERELLKDFQKYGLVGAVTDFGPLLLLFTPRDIVHFEFSLRGSQTLGATQALVFHYRQIDGAEMLTVFDKDRNQPHRLRIEGELWVRADNYLPLRVTLAAGEGEGPSSMREEASVDYTESSFGALVPSSIDHKELVRGQLTVQNSFIYKDFHKFGADSAIQFNPTQFNPTQSKPTK